MKRRKNQGCIGMQHALEIVGQNGYSHQLVTELTGWQYPKKLQNRHQFIFLSEKVIEQYAAECILIPMHPDACVLRILEMMQQRNPQHRIPSWARTKCGSKVSASPGWVFMKKNEVPDTLEKSLALQKSKLAKGQAIPWLFEWVFGITLHYLRTGENLTPDTFLRCQDEITPNARVCVNGYDQYGLNADSVVPDACSSRNIALAGIWNC